MVLGDDTLTSIIFPLIQWINNFNIHADQEMLQVCRDFLKKMCKRYPCKYAHPDSKTEVCSSNMMNLEIIMIKIA